MTQPDLIRGMPRFQYYKLYNKGLLSIREPKSTTERLQARRAYWRERYRLLAAEAKKKALASGKRWRAANPDRVKAIRARWAAKNREATKVSRALGISLAQARLALSSRKGSRREGEAEKKTMKPAEREGATI